MFEVFEGHARRLLDEAGAYVTMVDVGARGGVYELRAFAERVDLVGIEANPDAYGELVENRTWWAQQGVALPPYRSVRWLNLALGDDDGTAQFNVLRNPGASGLLPVDLERTGEWSWRAGFEIDAGTYFETDRIEEVPLRRLDTLAPELALEHVDYLKVDVEGSEYEVLAGAEGLLPRVGLIRCEVGFVPRRIGQKLFSHVDLLLRDHGFDLLRYEYDQEQIGYKERTVPTVFGPDLGYADRYGQPVIAEAIYVNRELADRVRNLVQAVLLIDRNYLDEALYVLKRRTDVRDDELFARLRDYRHLKRAHKAFLAARGAAGTAKRLLRRT